MPDVSWAIHSGLIFLGGDGVCRLGLPRAGYPLSRRVPGGEPLGRVMGKGKAGIGVARP